MELNGNTIFVMQGADRIDFILATPDDTNLAGRAQAPGGGGGNFTGTRNGGVFSISVRWDAGPTGKYQWTVNSHNVIQGTVTDPGDNSSASLTGTADYLS
ncbi:hypothetical protein VAR608DRAFT_4912 [Variovorax sp. HW608]|uniref:hypothetical protein n=1 Tax=Variovorax sp. HW608 TaxID=1034889 RepID=UPI00081FFA32|nr:hypothetical protein [Variovorax sp. HW608]SCK49334.1 hypothetical protein VAR608DRAFT_4912 [Variovorax sp. HW608]